MKSPAQRGRAFQDETGRCSRRRDDHLSRARDAPVCLALSALNEQEAEAA